MCTAVGLHGAVKSADSSMLLFGNVWETLSPGGGTLLQTPAVSKRAGAATLVIGYSKHLILNMLRHEPQECALGASTVCWRSTADKLHCVN